jgi:hypothetical protein
MIPTTRDICHSNYHYRFTSVPYQPKTIESFLVQGIEDFNSQFTNPIHHISMEEVLFQIEHLSQNKSALSFFPKSMINYNCIFQFHVF